MHDIPAQRFAGARAAFGAFGAPSITGWHVPRAVLIALGVLGLVGILYAVGAIDAHGVAFATIVMPVAAGSAGGGTGKAVELREQALAKLLEAKALVGDDDSVPDEDMPRFQALMAEFREIDKAAAKAQTDDDNIGTLRERFEFYTGKATGTPMRFQATQLDPNAPKSLGRQFVESESYKNLKAKGVFASPDSRFRSDPVVLAPSLNPRAAASDILQTESGGPVNGLIQPYRPGIVLPFGQAPLVFRDLFANETMPSGDTIEYAAQVGFDNAAAAVAQAVAANGSGLTGGVKPQSSIAWEERSSKATWIATWMAASRQALADETQLASLIDNQGRLMIRIEEDDQLINGNGTPPNLSGILDQVGLQTLDLTGEDNLDGFRTARRLVKTGLSRLDPTFIAINPEDSEEVDLLRDGNGQYRGGNPIGNFNFDQSIWRLQRAETEALDPGLVLVGARAGATVYERQPITVLTADQHADFFVRNLVVILFEERLAFPVYFPTAFVEVTLGDWDTGS